MDAWTLTANEISNLAGGLLETGRGFGEGGGAPGNAGSYTDTPISYKTNEAKIARRFAEQIDRGSFNPALFAFVLMQEGPSTSERAFEIALEIVRQMAINLGTGMTHTEKELEYSVQAARMIDGLNQFAKRKRGKHIRDDDTQEL